MTRTLTVLLALCLSGSASATDVRLGGHGTVLVLGPDHELYDPVTSERLLQPWTAGAGVLAGVSVVDWLDVEAGADISAWPIAGGTATIGTMRIGPRLVLRDVRPGVHLAFSGGVGNILVMADDGLMGKDADWAVHLGPGVEYALDDRLSLRGDWLGIWSTHVGADATSPSRHVRVGAGATYRFGPERIVEPVDSDGDGINDDVDACVDEAEVANGFLDEDGCADALADLTIAVRDGDGEAVAGASVVVDGENLGLTNSAGTISVSGRMPGTTAAVRVEAEHADPATADLELKQGGNAVELDLVWNPGAVWISATGPDGQPVDAHVLGTSEGREDVEWELGDDGADYHKLTPGAWRLAVKAEGLSARVEVVQIESDADALLKVRFQLADAKVEVAETTLDLADVVLFETDSHEVRAESRALLKEVAHLLIAHPDVKLLRVEGHTDSVGDDAANLALSQARVDEVARLLVEYGVAMERLSAEGFGETRPIADNDTEEGRAINRRVEFHVEREAGAEPVRR